MFRLGKAYGFVQPHCSSSLIKPFVSNTPCPISRHDYLSCRNRKIPSMSMESHDGESLAESPSFLKVLWRFTRPHTIIGSALAIPSVHLLAAPSLQAALSIRTAYSILYAMVPSLLINLYVTGLNQITDVEIDRINKPNLPIAAGYLSQRNAFIIVLASLLGALWMGFSNPVFGTEGLRTALVGAAILGTAYSVEPLRLKKIPLLAAFCIVAVRGVLANAGFFAHAKAAAYGQTSATVLSCLRDYPQCLLSSLFFAVFGIVIALMKDVPDVAGDRMSNIQTFSVRLGQRQVFLGTRNLLTLLFIGSGSAFFKLAASSPTTYVSCSRAIVGFSLGVLGCSVLRESLNVDSSSSDQVYGYYMHLWKLFYLSYFVLPFAM